MTTDSPEWNVIVCEPGCCEGCPDCLGMGLGCHNRPATRLLAEVRRLGDRRQDDPVKETR